MKPYNSNHSLFFALIAVLGAAICASLQAQTPPSLLQQAFPGVPVKYQASGAGDYVPIAINSARTWGSPNGVDVVFTVPVDPLTATNKANYTITPGIVVQGAAMGTNAWTVKLTTTAMTDTALHTIAVSNVRDLSNPTNTITAGSTAPILKAQGVITRKVFTGIAGNWLNSLTNNAKFPDSPDLTDWQLNFEAPSNIGDYYGLQMLGYVCPPITGDYQFYIASDNEGLLYFNTNASPAGKIAIASVPDATGSSRQWTKYSSQASAFFRLEAGKIYYIEALMGESTGNDWLAVTWRMRGMPAPAGGDAPIPGGFLSSISPSGAAGIATAPQGTTVPERQSAAFSVSASGTPLYTFQWLKNGMAIPGATAASYTVPAAAYSDNNALFSVIVGNFFSSITSSPAKLTVVADTAPPMLTRVSGGPTLDRVLLSFSEPVTPATAINPANYALGEGLSVLGAEPLPDQTNVVLTTTAQTPGQLYTIAVTGVTDVAAAHNAANTSSNFTAWTLQRGFVRREVFTGISGSSIADLANSANFPDNPDPADYVTQSEAPQNIGSNRGERLVGLLMPPTTGYYIFYFYSADQGALYLSADETPANKALIATEPSWNSYRNWVGTDRRNTASPENRSAPIYLQAGSRYYFEAQMKDSDGDNRLGVTWQLPGAPMPVNGDPPISSAYLASYANSVGPSLVITQNPPATLSVAESTFTNLTVGVTSSYSPVFYQWQKNGADIPGANASAYTTPRLLRTDNGANFRCVVTIPGVTRFSTSALLSVVQDNTAPQALSAATLPGSTNLGIAFSELMNAASATNPANYRLSIGGAVTSATLLADGQSVALGITALSFTNYTVILNNLKDYAGNQLPANTAVPVAVNQLENTDVGIPGDPLVIGSTYSTSLGNFDVFAGGSDIWNARDAFHFVYQQREGDFDARVRVARLDATAYYSFAGLHLRESLYPGSRGMKVVVASPTGGNGYHVGYRAATDGGSANWPGYGTIVSSGTPIPNAWIRLTRTNDLFVAWRGTNGVDWTAFAQMSMSFTGRVYVGLAACPVNNNPGQGITAWFRDFSISPAVQLPAPIDLQVKGSADAPSAYALNNTYQTAPAGAQLLSQSASPTGAASFMVKIENDGAVDQPSVLRALESGDTGWTLTYLLGGSNITALITNTAGFALANLPAGGAEYLQVDMLPGSRLPGASTRNVTLKCTTDSYTRSQRDAVQCVAVNQQIFQPDMQVRRVSDVVYAGIGIYNSTGSNQTKSVTADAGTTIVYPLQLVNAGNLTNAFKVTAGAGGGFWTVKYFDSLAGGSDITAEITGPGTGISLLPGASWELRAEVTLLDGVTPGSSNTLSVTAVAMANPARTDTVKMVSVAQIVTTIPQSMVFTSDANFERGTRVGTVYGNNQLTLSPDSVTWPFIWVPNSDKGTVSKVDVRTGREIARYRTSPSGLNAQPSRTTIDQQGNCWVANRQIGSMVKIGLLESGNFIDRNANGVPDTSADVNGDGDITGAELLPWGQDECVLYEVIAIPGKEGTFTPGSYTNGYVDNYWNPGPRGIAVDYFGNVWLGTHDTEKYYYLDGNTARIIRTNDLSSVDHMAYGAVVDGNGILWSSGYRESGTSTVLRLDPTDNSMVTIAPGFHTYGLGLDRSNHLFVSGHQESKLARINALSTNIEWIVSAGYQSRGVAVTDDGDVWVASSSEGNVWRFSNNGVFKGKISVGATPTGVSVDSAGKVWVVNDGDQYIKRIDPAIGAIGAIDLSKRIIDGVHYGYSDMTGIIARSTTGRFGNWTVTHDAVVHYTQWGLVSWNGLEPAGNNIVVRVRSSENLAAWSAWESVTNGVPLSTTPPGRYLQVEVSLRARAGAALPVLYDLTVQPLSQRMADVAITQTVLPLVATNEHMVSWTLSATNNGPQDARGVYITDYLPANISLVSATSSHGTISLVAGGISCLLDDLKTGSNFTMTVTAMVTAPGTLANAVAIGNYETDPSTANNTSVLTTTAVENPCVSPPAGLTGWWAGDGTPNDLVGTNNGVLAGGAAYATGKSGMAFSLNGSSAYVDLGRVSPGTKWSLEAWVNFSATLSGRRVIIGCEADCRDWALVANAGELGINIGKSGCAAIYGSGIIATNGAWYHVVGTCDGTNAAIYVNGQLRNSGTVDLNYVGSSSGLRIGSGVCCGEYMAGLVDEPSLYNRALTAAEVFALYDAGASGKCKASFSPTMEIAPDGEGILNISWPVAAGAFQLETTTNLLGGYWQRWINPPVIQTNNQFVLSIPPTNALQFFRLIK